LASRVDLNAVFDGEDTVQRICAMSGGSTRDLIRLLIDAALNAQVHDWVRSRGFEFFAPEGCRSLSLTCVKNNRDIDVAAWIKRLREKHRFVIDGGYGKLKGKTFRISNMGDETSESIATLLAALDDTLE
jgi:aspartate aminotransferase-like enzyme